MHNTTDTDRDLDNPLAPLTREWETLDDLRPAPGEEKTQHELDELAFDAALCNVLDVADKAKVRLFPRRADRTRFQGRAQ